MNFVSPTPKQFADTLDRYGYRLLYVTDDEEWSIALKQVMFGWRAIAYEKDSIGCLADYCAGPSAIFAIEIAATLKAIFECLPPDATNADINAVLPVWGARPINKDSCWDKLQETARRLQTESSQAGLALQGGVEK